MTQAELQELEELAAAIEESEGLPPRAARRKASSILADLKRQAHRWDDQAFAAGNPTAIDTKQN
jgi:hypothetical protein